MLTAFFLDDVLGGNIDQFSPFHHVPGQDGNYAENVSDPRPGVPWISGANQAGQFGWGSFAITDTNKYLDFSPTAASVFQTVTLNTGTFPGAQLASIITAKMQAFASNLKYWSCSYNDATGKFRMGVAPGAGSSPDLMLRFATGPNAQKTAGPTMGFQRLDYPDLVEHYSAYSITSTHTWLLFDLGAGGAKLNAFMCEIEDDEDIDGASVTMYGSSTALGAGFQLQNWIDNADKTLTFSDSPSYSENKVRVAFDTDGAQMIYRYWLFSWRHNDSFSRHKVRLVKGFSRISSETRTINTLKGHGLLNPAKPLGKKNYYPVNQLRNWKVPLEFDAWGASDYRQVIHKVVRFGKQKGMLWALRWDDIADGSVQADDEANKGYLVWCALDRYSQDTYVGEGADYISGELLLEQIR